MQSYYKDKMIPRLARFENILNDGGTKPKCEISKKQQFARVRNIEINRKEKKQIFRFSSSLLLANGYPAKMMKIKSVPFGTKHQFYNFCTHNMLDNFLIKKMVFFQAFLQQEKID